MADAPELVGTVEAAEILGLERSTLARWVQLGKLDPAHKLPGRNGAYLFDRAEIERLRQEMADEPAAAEAAG